MSSLTSDEACINLANNFQDFIFHRKNWEKVLEDIANIVNILSVNTYSVGYSDGNKGTTESPPQVSDWRWMLQLRNGP